MPAERLNADAPKAGDPETTRGASLRNTAAAVTLECGQIAWRHLRPIERRVAVKFRKGCA
jgi:hypothetical protein